MRPVAVVDFETYAIEGRPQYPPAPVGVALAVEGQKPKYLSWGHQSGNTCDKATAQRQLKDLWKSHQLVLFNAKFDLDVAETHLGLPVPAPDRYDDAMIMGYLHDPYAPRLGLKPLAEAVLGMKPAEQDELQAWAMANSSRLSQTAVGAKAHYMEHIPEYPAEVVGPYALGDVARTKALYNFYQPALREASLTEAYDRERQLLPYLLTNERKGLPVDVDRLGQDLIKFHLTLDQLDDWIRKRLKSPSLNIDSNAQLADAIDLAGLATHWEATASGKRSTSKKSLPSMLKDKVLLAALLYRGPLMTCVNTFMRPWLTMALANNGRIQTNWNQVRNPENRGTRTGRLSSNPNFQNIPNELDKVYEQLAAFQKELRFALPPPPAVKSYIVPDPGAVLLNRDYNQQEMRILAHFEDGPMLEAYLADPWMDAHDKAAQIITDMVGIKLDRKQTKNIAFGIVYGMGLEKLAASLGVEYNTAQRFRSAYLTVFPGIKFLMNETQRSGGLGEPIRTWGGRTYYVEPPKVIDGRERTFEYKLLNYLIQGSAADNTKQAMINYHELPGEGYFGLQVHDELLAVAPKKLVKQEMKRLKEAMEAVKFDVPMLSKGYVSDVSWYKMDALPKGE